MTPIRGRRAMSTGETIVGLCEQGKEPELAEAYMNLLLSDPMMRKWWLD